MVKKNKFAQDSVIETEGAAEVKGQKKEESKGVTLGSGRAQTVGRNKSGMPWKKGSKRSEFSKGPPISYLKSMEEKARLKRIRERVGALREERKNSKQEQRRRQKEKAERKKINEFKSSTYQVVSLKEVTDENYHTIVSFFTCYRLIICPRQENGDVKHAKLWLKCQLRLSMKSTNEIDKVCLKPFN